MRFFPEALALSLLGFVTASASLSAPAEPLAPRAAALEAQARAALAAGDNARATDCLEAALAVQPGSAVIVLGLAAAANKRGMPGEALHYYREVLTAQPLNINALAGQGATLAQIGALDKAQRNLVQVRGLCGPECPDARILTEAIAKVGSPHASASPAMATPAALTKN